MSASDRTFLMHGSVAVPIGHRVEVSIYSKDEGTFTRRPVLRLDQPVVRDLDTGVVHSHWWHHIENPPFPGDVVPLELRDMPLADRMVGRVIACQIVFYGDETSPRTTLVVRPEPEPSGYR